MKRRRFDLVFPHNISDETASALGDFLYQLAAACENRYFVQIRRYHRRQMNLYDPDAPWRSPPTKTP
jgi:hypothetical protein